MFEAAIIGLMYTVSPKIDVSPCFRPKKVLKKI